MRKLWVLAVVVGIATGTFLWDWLGHEPKTDFRVIGSSDYREDGRVAALGPYLGEGKKVTVVHFWATWCPPCMVEMPGVLAALKGVPDGVQVVMVDLDAPLASDFYAKWGIERQAAGVRWIEDPEQALAKVVLGKVMLPTTVVVGGTPAGVIQQVDGPLNWPTFLKALR